MKKYIKLIKSLSVTAILLLSFTSQAGIYSGFKWGDSAIGTSGGEVTWSLMADGISCAGPFEPAGCITSDLASFMPDGFLDEIERAFNTWSGIADITFNMVPDGGEPFGGVPSADIRIAGHYFDGVNGELAHAYYPVANTGGDIHFDTSEAWSIDGYIDIFSVALHEIGHAIGIGHSTDTSAVMYPIYGGPITGLQSDDIEIAQFIYGAAQVQASVPEPSSIVLFMSMMGLVLVNKRKQAQSNI